MGRRTRALIAAAPLALACACGDPVIIIGDAPGLMRIVAGVPDTTGTVIDSSATRTLLRLPMAALFDDATDLLYVADQGAERLVNGVLQPLGRLFEIHSNGRLRPVLESGCHGSLCVGRPVALARAPDGSLLVADETGGRILSVDPASGAIAVVAGTGVVAFSPDGTPATAATLERPGGIAVGPDGAIYVSESAGHRVRVIRDGVLGTVAGTGLRGTAGDGGPAVLARLDSPTGLVLAGTTLFVADEGNERVRALDLVTGVIETIAGTGVRGSGGDGGPAELAALSGPHALAVAADGRLLYITELLGHRVRVVNLATAVISTFAGTGQPGFGGAGRPAGQTLLDRPMGVAGSERGFLIIADAGNGVVWRTTVLP